MATNPPAGDGHRNGAIRKRSQIKTKIMGEERYTKRSIKTGEFLAQKKMAPSSKVSAGSDYDRKYQESRQRGDHACARAA